MAALKPFYYDSANKLWKKITSPDTLDASVTSTLATTLNVTADAALVIGNAVYITTADHADLASAAAIGTARCIGLVKDASVESAATGDVVVSGELSATTGQWDVVAGTTGGLTAGTDYYLSKANAGKLVTDISAYTTGDFVVYVGHAVSTTKMKVNPQTQIIAL